MLPAHRRDQISCRKEPKPAARGRLYCAWCKIRWYSMGLGQEQLGLARLWTIGHVGDVACATYRSALKLPVHGVLLLNTLQA